ncbi:serine-rich adhesin for platelets [Periplaneta americana]|uniref:serine-rich adhesin for platelets n=1 Tax=Periplaneta americana TaxID=6978 RepID=UPI0037E9B8E2
MFGIKFRSWMETHIVRPRKKQQQQRCKEGNVSKSKSSGKVVPERPLLDSAGNSPTSPLIAKKDEPQKNQHVLRCGLIYSEEIQHTAGGVSTCSKAMETIALPSNHHHHHHHHHHHGYMGNNLSSPESAYSTGYSTDGTSPGASFPPEYYINIRTGTHYFHSSTTTPTAPCSLVPVGHDPHLNLPHRHLVSAHGREEASKSRSSRDVRNGCVVEVEILNPREGFDGRHITHTSTPKVLPAPEPASRSQASHSHSHRRTESCDESRRYPAAIRTSFAQLDDATSITPPPSAGPGTSLTVNPITNSIINPTSSPQSVAQLTASPRQRNRIRTNPWLPSSTPSNSSAISTNSSTSSSNNAANFKTRAVPEIGESSTNISSCSSGTGCKHTQTMQGESSSSYGSGSDVTLPRKQPLQQQTMAKDGEHISEENVRSSPHLRGWCHTPPGDSNASGSNSSCKHHRGSVCSSSSSSSSSHTANNYSHSNTSDMSDDDLTLNEMLGKYDESYIYEKETDILSDSDPTDCEEDYGETDFDTGQDGGDEREPQEDEELDFIDNGSYLELNPLDLDDGTDKSSSSAKGLVNKGHCTYHMPHSGTEFVRKSTTRFRESFLRRSSARRHGVKDENVSRSPGPSSRRASVRRFNNEEGLNRRVSRDGSRHRRHHEPSSNSGTAANNTGPLNHTLAGNSSSRSSSEKRKIRCSLRRNCNVRGVPNKNVPPPVVNNNGITFNSKEKISIVEAENAGVYNLNRILMQKMLLHVNGSGSRSAGNTPVSLRKKIINDDTRRKVLSPSRLKPRIEDNRLKWDIDKNQNTNDVQTSPMRENVIKKRSYSISCGTRSEEFRKGIPTSTYLTTFSSEIALIEADKEADRKYKELILEAEHILVSMKENSSEKCFNFIVPPPPQEFNSKESNDNCVNENGNTVTGTKDVDGDTTELSCENRNNVIKPAIMNKTFNSPKRVLDENRRTSRREKEQNVNRTNSPSKRIVTEGKRSCEFNRRGRLKTPEGLIHASSSSSTDSDGSITPKKSPTLPPTVPVQTAQQRPPLVTFRSIDLGNELGGSGYCPQSEPVKRKVYTCSSTFDRLQKSLEKSHHQASLRLKAEREDRNDDKGRTEGDSRRDSLKEKLERLRRERLEVEAKVREAQEEERQRLDDKAQCQRQLSLFRRQMLVHTIEGLKRSLEDQSAKLQETYNQQEQQQSSEEEDICRTHSTSSSSSNKECQTQNQNSAE